MTEQQRQGLILRLDNALHIMQFGKRLATDIHIWANIETTSRLTKEVLIENGGKAGYAIVHRIVCQIEYKIVELFKKRFYSQP